MRSVEEEPHGSRVGSNRGWSLIHGLLGGGISESSCRYDGANTFSVHNTMCYDELVSEKGSNISYQMHLFLLPLPTNMKPSSSSLLPPAPPRCYNDPEQCHFYGSVRCR